MGMRAQKKKGELYAQQIKKDLLHARELAGGRGSQSAAVWAQGVASSGESVSRGDKALGLEQVAHLVLDRGR